MPELPDVEMFKQYLEDGPQYDRLLITFANGYHLAYVSQHKLGELALIDSVEAFVRREELGPDAMRPSSGSRFRAAAPIIAPTGRANPPARQGKWG